MRERELIAVQMSIADGDSFGNLKRAATHIAASNPAAKAIVVLPELVNTGYDWQAIAGLSDAESEEHIRQLSGVAAKHGIFLIAGSIAEAIGELRFNSAYVIGPDGKILGRYVKCHLFSPFGEDDHFARGNSSLVSNLGGIYCGVSICYDLRFPELYRRQTLDGAELLGIPAVWPLNRGNIWKTLLIARAMEQQCFVIGVNRAGTDTNCIEYGGSLIIDPWGNILAESADSEEAILKTSSDFAEVNKARSHIPSLIQRRPDVYRLDWEISAEIEAMADGDF